MHDSIKKFSLHGELQDKVVVQAKERMEAFLESMMRDKGCVPSLDLNPQFTTNYVPEKEIFEFDLSVYGVYVGREEAWQVSGITNGKKIPKYTPKNKSQASSDTSM